MPRSPYSVQLWPNLWELWVNTFLSQNSKYGAKFGLCSPQANMYMSIRISIGTQGYLSHEVVRAVKRIPSVWMWYNFLVFPQPSTRHDGSSYSIVKCILHFKSTSTDVSLPRHRWGRSKLLGLERRSSQILKIYSVATQRSGRHRKYTTFASRKSASAHMYL